MLFPIFKNVLASAFSITGISSFKYISKFLLMVSLITSSKNSKSVVLDKKKNFPPYSKFYPHQTNSTNALYHRQHSLSIRDLYTVRSSRHPSRTPPLANVPSFSNQLMGKQDRIKNGAFERKIADKTYSRWLSCHHGHESASKVFYHPRDIRLRCAMPEYLRPFRIFDSPNQHYKKLFY